MKHSVHKLAMVLVLAVGFGLGVAASRFQPTVQAEVKSKTRMPVPSGGLQSAAELRNVTATLKSIDARLSRIETNVKQIAVQGAGK